jgi:vacuolar-type H+-ATPase subunit H
MDDAKIKEIKTAELDAQKILDEAKVEYSRILHSAGEEGIVLLDTEKKKVKDESRALTDRYRKEGEAEAKSVLSQLDPQKKAIDDKSAAAKTRAAEYLINQLKGKYGSR